jgi:hypothetical protein
MDGRWISGQTIPIHLVRVAFQAATAAQIERQLIPIQFVRINPIAQFVKHGHGFK